MSGIQRVAFLLVAAVIAVGALVLLGGSGDEEPQRSAAERTPTPSSTATPVPPEAEPRSTPEPEPTAVGQPVAPLLSAGGDRLLRFTEGERVRFRVRSDVPEEIHVHGYDIERALPAGETVTIAFPATITGIFEVELHGSGEPLGRIRVDPA